MDSTHAGPGKRASFAPALFLLFVAVTINYIDRGNLSIAAPLLEGRMASERIRTGGALLGILLDLHRHAVRGRMGVRSF